MRKLPNKYWEAIIWIARNDDNEWLADSDPVASVTLTMVADLWNVPIAKATEHLRKAMEGWHRHGD